MRTYIPDKKQTGERHWTGKAEEQRAVYANRRRIKGIYGKRLLRKRGELIERSFAHCYDTGGMRRTHLRGRHSSAPVHRPTLCFCSVELSRCRNPRYLRYKLRHSRERDSATGGLVRFHCKHAP